jgi:streptomycin 6-kinase
VAWVEGLPDVVESLANAWSLTLQPHFDNLSYNYVTPVRCADGTAAVLKLSIPEDVETTTEIEALRHFDGSGAVRLLKVDLQQGAALLQRLDPGLPLSTLNDDTAEVAAAVSVMRALWRLPPASAAFPSMANWLENVATIAQLLPKQYDWLDAGIELGRDLIAAQAAGTILLHGDMHHSNVLSSGDNWLCIDPKGVCGEPAWEIGPYLHNNLPTAEGEASWRRIIRRRADQFAEELALDRQRVYTCAAVYAVISSAWSLEEGYGPERTAKRRAVMQELGAF